MRRVVSVLASVVAVAALAGCTAERVVVDPETAAPAPVPDQPEPDRPVPDGPAGDGPAVDVPDPRFHVATDQADVDLAPFTYCWTGPASGVCADGMPEPGRVVVAAADELVVSFVTSDGTLEAFLGAPGGDQTSLPVSAVDDGWVVDLTDAPDGDQVVTLTWNGQQGDAHAALTVRR